MNEPIKTPFDSLTLRAVTAELRQKLIGGQIQDIRQPAPSEILLAIRSQGKNYLLLCSDDARFARVHLTNLKRPNSPTPPTFCMSLRKHLEGCAIRDIRQRGFDRVLEIEVDSHTDVGDRTVVTLILELMGKHSNLILVNEKGNVLEAAKRITKKVSRFREILPGQPYLSPPGQLGRINPFDANSFEPLRKFLSDDELPNSSKPSEFLLEHYAGMSPFLAKELLFPLSGASLSASVLSALKSRWDEIFHRSPAQSSQPVLIRQAGNPAGAYPFRLEHLSDELQTTVEDLNSALDAAFQYQSNRAGLSAVSSELKGRIDRDLKRFQKQKESAERALEESAKAEGHKQTGELILANLWRIDSGATEIVVQDYFAPDYPERGILLNPELNPQENAEVWFKRYRKQRDGEETALKRNVESEEKLAALRAAKARVAHWEATDVLSESLVSELREELKATGLLRQSPGENKDNSRSAPDFQGHRIKRFTTPEGYEILIGESATANDFLTLRLASPNDWWLHVRSSTSSHVVVKTLGKPDLVPKSVLYQAALLCAKHSSQKHSSIVPVDFTLKKFVRKPRGADPGGADYRNEKTLEVNPAEG